MKITDINVLIKIFLNRYCTKVIEEETTEDVKEMLKDNISILYEGEEFHLPKNIEMMDANDQLLSIMILNTFQI